MQSLFIRVDIKIDLLSERCGISLFIENDNYI
jgi:hypothetical protein